MRERHNSTDKGTTEMWYPHSLNGFISENGTKHYLQRIEISLAVGDFLDMTGMMAFWIKTAVNLRLGMTRSSA